MDYQKYADMCKSMTCVISVEKKPDGGYGTIRLVAGSKLYIDSIENPAQMSSSAMLDNKFVPNCEYTRYIPKDKNFEELVYTSAVLGHPQHTYVRPDRYPFWINVFAMPLESDDPDLCYCTYTMEITKERDADMMTNLSPEAYAYVLKTCIKLRKSDDSLANFNEVVSDIREICDSEHCCILLTDKERRECIVYGESIKEGCGRLPMAAYLDNNFFEITQTWKDTIAGSTCYIAKNEEDMAELRKNNPLWGESLRGAGVKTIVLFPLEYNGDTYGYIWALDFNTENTSKIKEALELATFFIASEIANLRLVQKLKRLSSVDLLTGVMNRNAMNNRVDSIVHCDKKSKPVGVIFTDINGLKYVNDHEGHNAGDILIKSAAAVLNDICGENEIYRAGGDEFMIIVSDIDREGFEHLVEKLRIFSDTSNGVSFAVGGYFDDKELDIRKAMRIADEQMYIDKVRCYKRFPERKRSN